MLGEKRQIRLGVFYPLGVYFIVYVCETEIKHKSIVSKDQRETLCVLSNRQVIGYFLHNTKENDNRNCLICTFFPFKNFSCSFSYAVQGS